jgi:hypothetical protein
MKSALEPQAISDNLRWARDALLVGPGFETDYSLLLVRPHLPTFGDGDDDVTVTTTYCVNVGAARRSIVSGATGLRQGEAGPLGA